MVRTYRNALEANRLEMHWKKLCEQEQRSQKRNRELLKDFERVAQQALVFDSRTQRLKAAKVFGVQCKFADFYSFVNCLSKYFHNKDKASSTR